MPDTTTGRTGLAVITFNRLECLRDCVTSLESHGWGHAHVRLIVDDGSTQPGYGEFLGQCARRGIAVIRHTINQGVAGAKNDALKHLMDAGCQHLFLIEDDIVMRSAGTLAHYIGWGRQTGLEHLNFALHGETNINREQLTRHGRYWALYYPTAVGAFSYYTRRVIEQVGYFDPGFQNAFEHIDHTYRTAKAGLTLPFWQFADHPLNSDLLAEQPQSIQNSVIRQGDWKTLVVEAKRYWAKKHGPWPPARL